MSRRRGRAWAVLAGLVAAAGCGAGHPASGAGSPVPPVPGAADEVAGVGSDRTGAVPDPGWELRPLEGGRVTLGEHRGRPVLVNLWATWCPPCVQELASLDRLADRVRDTGVAFLLVTPEAEGPVREFLDRRPLGIPVHLEGTLAPEAFGPLVLPTTFILDARGVVRLHHRGAAEWDTPEVEAFLRSLDAEGVS